jgi:hypothetical protein
MYDIVTHEPEDHVVETAYNSIIGGHGAIPGPTGGYRLIVPGNTHAHGDGGAHSATLVVVGHGNVNSLSGYANWAAYQKNVNQHVNWAEKTHVYLAACSVNAPDGTAFLHGNFARSVKAAFPHAIVWASSSNVTARTQAGDWHQL